MSLFLVLTAGFGLFWLFRGIYYIGFAFFLLFRNAVDAIRHPDDWE